MRITPQILTLSTVYIGILGVQIYLSLSIPTSIFIGSWHIPVWYLLIANTIVLVTMSMIFMTRALQITSIILAASTIGIFGMMGYLSLFFPILSDGIQVSEDLICTKVGWCEKQDNLGSLICSERVYNAHKYEEIITSYEEQIAHIETCKKTINVETAPEKTTLIELKKGYHPVKHVDRHAFGYTYVMQNGIRFDSIELDQKPNIHIVGHDLSWVLWVRNGIH